MGRWTMGAGARGAHRVRVRGVHQWMRRRSLGLAVSLLVQAGCESPMDELNCPAIILPTFEISVFEAATLDPIDGPLVLTRTGSRTDTLNVANHRAVGPWGISGTFDVSVTKTGYSDWFREDVNVQEGPCGPATVRFDVYLEKYPDGGAYGA